MASYTATGRLAGWGTDALPNVEPGTPRYVRASTLKERYVEQVSDDDTW
jgi:hypothetical protein